ncbi:MAG: DUF1697 domain-containing protein [Pyrinomonadaceae bacterium]
MKYVAFLRGINIGGKNKIKMESLREVCSGIGFENVKTYINSGNVIFETRKTDDNKLAARIEKAIEGEFSLAIRVMVRPFAELEELVENNPFAGQFDDPKNLHVLFLDEELSAEKCEMLLENNCENEMYAVRRREIFCLLRISVLDSLFFGRDYVGKKLRVSATSRNWRTVSKVLEF